MVDKRTLYAPNSQWQHAISVKKTSSYWRSMFFDYLKQGKTEQTIRRLVTQPSKTWYPTAHSMYDAGMSQALEDYRRYLEDIRRAEMKGQQATEMGFIYDQKGNVWDTTTGKLVREEPHEDSPKKNDSSMLYVLIASAGLLLFMIIRKKKKG